MTRALACFLAASVAGAVLIRAQAPQQLPQGDVPFKIVKLDPALDAIISPDAKLETIGDRFGLAEGPVWMPGPRGAQDGFLLFSDIAAT